MTQNSIPSQIDPELFTRWVRHALQNLYDFTELRRSPLVAFLDIKEAVGPALLQRVIINAIEALRPAAGVNAQSNAARSYRILYHRYVEQFTQAEVADDLGIGDRQLRRQEVLAVESLSGELAARFGLNLTSGSLIQEVAAEGSEDKDIPDPVDVSIERGEDTEWEWMQRSFPVEVVPVRTLVQSALSTVKNLAQSLQICLTPQIPDTLPDVMVQVASVQQALVITLSEAMQNAGRAFGHPDASTLSEKGSQNPTGEIRLEAVHIPERHQVRLLVRDAVSTPDLTNELKLAGRLAALSGGSIRLLTEDKFSIVIDLPAPDRVPVLFIDDNADTLQLFQRYLIGTQYAFIGARDQEQAAIIIEKSKPQIIVTDVMMPGMDGWQLLGGLRRHPRTEGTPIVVCSILPQEQLAFSLGAMAFLRKPFSREQLLSTLSEMENLPATKLY